MSQNFLAIICARELELSQPIREKVPGTLSIEEHFPPAQNSVLKDWGYMFLNILFLTPFQLSA